MIYVNNGNKPIICSICESEIEVNGHCHKDNAGSEVICELCNEDKEEN